MMFEETTKQFDKLCLKYHVKFLLVGGEAVNFYGYKRHSADVDFRINPIPENFKKIISVFQDLGYSISELPGRL